MPDITNLKASWTKYDAVKLINIIGNDEIEKCQNDEIGIDQPVFKAYLGLNDFYSPIPEYWKELIKEYPQHRKMFALLAGIFTHYQNIEDFANTHSTQNMCGIYKITASGDKRQTNLRSALVESGAALNSYRRKEEVPYDFSRIFVQEEIGKLFKELLVDRLIKIGYSNDEIRTDFNKIILTHNFHKALSLEEMQFTNWLEGKPVYQIKKFLYDIKAFEKKYKQNKAFKIRQWLDEWNNVSFDLPFRKKPEGHFYMFKMDIRILKRISDVHRRKSHKPGVEEVNVQRALKEVRSVEIKNYVHKGFPLSTLNDKERNDPENKPLSMPGFLSTAILVNILGPEQKRGNSKIKSEDLITIKDINDDTSIILPDKVFDESWDPELKPIEIIDGQHRLWAFDETEKIDGNYEIPVIAYYDLDRAWQAYLFYVINIKPKKINTSLGYDLYPLLRTQEWLENSKDGLKVYRETRAQELVEALWSYPESPWYRRISMLGEETSYISQNAFIKAFTSSYFKNSKKTPRGLFSEVLEQKNEEIRWVRPQQAAFLILIWDEIAKALNDDNTKIGTYEWVDKLRNEKAPLTSFEKELELNKAFVSKSSHLSRDQGVTGISMFSNDFFYIIANDPTIDFNSLEWDSDIDERKIEASSIDLAINKFVDHPIYTYIELFAKEVIKLDWRTSSAEFDNQTQMELQKRYKGSGGYREVWNDLLKIFLESENEKMKKYATLLTL